MFHFSKFYKHIFINLLFVAMFIVSIFIIIFIGSNYKASKESLEQSYITQAKQLSTSIDYKLESGINLINKLSVDDVSENFINLKNPHPMLSLDLYSHIGSSASLIYNLDLTLGIYNDSLGTIVSNNSSGTPEFFLRKYNLNTDLDVLKLFDNEFGELDFPTATKLVTTLPHGEESLFYAVRKTHLPNQPLVFVIYSIHSLISDVTSNNAISDFSIGYRDDLSTLTTPKAGANNVIHLDSASLPLRYEFTFYPPKTVIPLKFISRIMVVFMFLMVLILVFIYIFSNKVYGPVRELMNSTIDPDYDEPIIDEFMHIQNHVGRLKDKINVYTLSIKDILLKEILYGIKKNHIDTLLENNNISLFSKESFMVIIANKNPHTASNFLDLKSHIELKLLSKWPDFKEYSHYKFINTSALYNVLFLNTISRPATKELLSTIATLCEDSNGIITDYIAAGDISDKFETINDLLKNGTLDNKDSIILEEEITLKPPTPYVFSASDQQLIRYSMTSGHKDDLFALLSNVLDENLLRRQLAPHIYHEFLSEICETLTSTCSDFKSNSQLLNLLTNITDPKEVKAAITNLFHDYFLHINAENSANNSNSNKYAFENYIHTNYDQDISLTDMAKEFNLAVNYVGVLFKESTGSNFKEYLNTYRINVSKQILLETPNIKIKDLAKSVGFLNTNTFIRIFKSYENITPGQYKKYVLHTNRDS